MYETPRVSMEHSTTHAGQMEAKALWQVPSPQAEYHCEAVPNNRCISEFDVNTNHLKAILKINGKRGLQSIVSRASNQTS